MSESKIPAVSFFLYSNLEKRIDAACKSNSLEGRHVVNAKYANLSADIANEDRFCLWPAWHGRATVYRLLVCCCFGAVAVCYRIKPAN